MFRCLNIKITLFYASSLSASNMLLPFFLTHNDRWWMVCILEIMLVCIWLNQKRCKICWKYNNLAGWPTKYKDAETNMAVFGCKVDRNHIEEQVFCMCKVSAASQKTMMVWESKIKSDLGKEQTPDRLQARCFQKKYWIKTSELG